TAGHVDERLFARRWVAALLVTLAATAIPLVTVATVLFAEPLFLALAAAALWVGELAARAEGRRALLLAAAAGVLAGLSAIPRSIGVALVIGLVLALLVTRRPRPALAAGLVAVLVMAPWSAFVSAHHAELDPAIAANYGTYGDLLKQSGWGWLS